MSSKHANIAIFVPHIGCKNRCSFCDQVSISGSVCAPTADDVKTAVKTAIDSKGYSPLSCEIAFFGGSFTAIEYDYMVELLSAAYEFVKSGVVSGIRVSTRPDAINEDILTILKSYGVTAIELGAQSMDDSVLKENFRGHTALDVKNASALIKQYGFSLGLQMMTGLYGSNTDLDRKTACEIINCKPDTVRIYPTITLKNTYLEKLFNDKKYLPNSLETAVEVCAEILNLFLDNNIKVIRLGLHSIDNNSYVAGPWHPAFSELCYSKLLYNNALKILKNQPSGKYKIFVNPSDISKAVGQHRENILNLTNKGWHCSVFADANIPQNDLKIIKDV